MLGPIILSVTVVQKQVGLQCRQKCLSNVDLSQNSNDMNISCIQGTHYSYLGLHYIRSDVLQSDPNKIFPMKG